MKYFKTIIKNIFHRTHILFLLGVFCSCETTEHPSTPKKKLISITEIISETPYIKGKAIRFTYKDHLLGSISKYLGPLLVDSLIVTYDSSNSNITTLKSTKSRYSIEYTYLANGLINLITENLEYQPEQTKYRTNSNKRHTITAFTKDSLIYNENNHLTAIINRTYDDHWTPIDSLFITYKTNTNGNFIEEFNKGTKTTYEYYTIDSPLKALPTALLFDRKHFLSVIYPFGNVNCKLKTTSISDQITQESVYKYYFTDRYIDRITEKMTYKTPNESLSSERYWEISFQ